MFAARRQPAHIAISNMVMYLFLKKIRSHSHTAPRLKSVMNAPTDTVKKRPPKNAGAKSGKVCMILWLGTVKYPALLTARRVR